MKFLYVACVNFMINGANLLGVTYRDINGVILLMIFPAITLFCLVMCFVPYARLRRGDTPAPEPHP